MKCELNCDIVQDLLPSYVDSLTSDATNESVQYHLNNCKNCSDIYSTMSAKDKPNQISINESKLIKKTKKQIIKIIICCVAAAIVLSCAGYFFTDWLGTSEVLTAADVNVEVQTIRAENISFSDTDENGEITIDFNGSESSIAITKENAEEIKNKGYLYQIVISSDKSIDIVDERVQEDGSICLEIWSQNKSILKRTKRLEYKILHYDEITNIYNPLTEDTRAQEILWTNE